MVQERQSLLITIDLRHSSRSRALMVNHKLTPVTGPNWDSRYGPNESIIRMQILGLLRVHVSVSSTDVKLSSRYRALLRDPGMARRQQLRQTVWEKREWTQANLWFGRRGPNKPTGLSEQTMRKQHGVEQRTRSRATSDGHDHIVSGPNPRNRITLRKSLLEDSDSAILCTC
jgi:hypothetical protein